MITVPLANFHRQPGWPHRAAKNPAGRNMDQPGGGRARKSLRRNARPPGAELWTAQPATVGLQGRLPPPLSPSGFETARFLPGRGMDWRHDRGTKGVASIQAVAVGLQTNLWEVQKTDRRAGPSSGAPLRPVARNRMSEVGFGPKQGENGVPERGCFPSQCQFGARCAVIGIFPARL